MIVGYARTNTSADIGINTYPHPTPCATTFCRRFGGLLDAPDTSHRRR